jgi:hypothetical protein
MKLLLCALLVCGSLTLVSPGHPSSGIMQIHAIVLILEDDPWDGRRPGTRGRRRNSYRFPHCG